MEQILIVADDSETDINDNEMADNNVTDSVTKKESMSETDKNNLKQTVSYLCELYKISSAGMDKVINDRVHDSVTARYLITAVTTLRNSNFIVDMFMHASRDEDVMEQLNAAIINLYASNDKLHNDISDAVVKVNGLKSENDDIRKAFETEIKAAFEREKETTTALIEQYKISLEAKDKTYTLIMRNNNDIKKENKELKEHVSDLKIKNDELKAMLALQNKNSVNKSENVSGDKEFNKNDNTARKGLFHFLNGRDDKNKTSDKKVSEVLDTFISDVLSNKEFSSEQKDFLMSCIEGGMSYSDVKRITKPELDVDMMKRLVRYYNKEN